jgi:hypothetical protein
LGGSSRALASPGVKRDLPHTIIHSHTERTVSISHEDRRILIAGGQNHCISKIPQDTLNSKEMELQCSYNKISLNVKLFGNLLLNGSSQ